MARKADLLKNLQMQLCDREQVISLASAYRVIPETVDGSKILSFGNGVTVLHR